MKKYIFIIAFFTVSFATNAQVGIGTTTPQSSSILEISSSNKALLVTRVTNTAAVNTPVKGMIVYSLAENKFKIYQTIKGVEQWVNLFI